MMFWIGFLFISIIGTLLHFTYDISKHNKIIALFSAVNESIWEHIKMALTPFFLWTLVDGLKYGANPNYFLAKLVGLLTIIIVIPLIFYGYKIILKKSILVIDILTFYIAILLSQYFTYLILKVNPISFVVSYISLVLIIIIFAIYLLVTIYPPKNSFFKDPITKKYGLKGHK